MLCCNSAGLFDRLNIQILLISFFICTVASLLELNCAVSSFPD